MDHGGRSKLDVLLNQFCTNTSLPSHWVQACQSCSSILLLIHCTRMKAAAIITHATYSQTAVVELALKAGSLMTMSKFEKTRMQQLTCTRSLVQDRERTSEANLTSPLCFHLHDIRSSESESSQLAIHLVHNRSAERPLNTREKQ